MRLRRVVSSLFIPFYFVDKDLDEGFGVLEKGFGYIFHKVNNNSELVCLERRMCVNATVVAG